MAVNKVVYGGETLVDLTGDNVSESTLLSGTTAHNAAGQAIVGTVTVPTKVSQLENDSGLATETYVNNKVAGIVDSAPTTLDTLNELAAALGDDPNFATTIANQIGTKVDKVNGKGLSTNDYTTTEKTKLSGIAEGAEVNQNAFSNVVVGSVTVAADSKTDTLTLVAGNNVTLTPDATNDKITIASKDTVYTHPSYTSKSSDLYKITVDGTGHVSGTTTVTKSDITALGIPAQDTTYSEATTSAAGLMSATDKTKLNGIAEGAEKNVQSDLSQTDNTATDYVKGIIRQESLPEGYPYRETVGTILDGTFEFAVTDGIYQHNIADENFVIVDNESYAVIWDGKTYRCVAAIFLGNAIVLGNLAIANAGADTGEPFLFVQQGANKLIGTTDTATTHTVTVCSETIHQIADDFIPDISRGMILKNFNGTMPSPMNWSSITYGNGKFVTVAMLYSEAAYCDDDLNWKSSTLPSSAWWFSIAYGNGKFVIVSFDNSTRAAYSEDGITWTATTMPSSADWRSVTYGNGKFVAVAQDSTTAAYSADGITWTAATLPSSQRWSSVTYGNDKFVAVAQDSTTAAYSTDGIAWTETTMPSSETWISITYGNGKFVAVANYSTTAAYSADGITWTAATMPSRANWYSITYGNGKFVTIADESTTAAYSEDGITWIQTTLPSSERWQSVTYGNGKFVAVVNASVTVAYSRDGINWKTELKLISQNGKDVTDDTLIALNHQPDLSQTDSTQVDYIKGVIRQESLPEGYPYRETVGTILDGTFEFANNDGIYIHTIADENFSIVPDESYAVIWDGKTYRCAGTIFNGSVMVLGNLAIVPGAGVDTGEPFLFVYQGSNAAYIYAKDNATTHTVTVCAEAIHQIADDFIPDIGRGMILKNFNGVMPARSKWKSVTYGNGKFVAVDFLSGIAAYREDDSTWKSAIMPGTSYWSSVTYGNGKFVAVADDSSTAAAYSEDGITWTAATLPSSEYWQSVTYGDGKFVAVSQNSTVAAYSTDGITWTASTLPSSSDWRSVTYGNGKFVAVASNSTSSAYSTDGITWTATTLPSTANWYSVTYGNGKFVAIAHGSDKAAYSTDGITWTATTMPISETWNSVAYGNGKFVAVIFRSDKAAYSTDGITWTATTMPISETWNSVAYGNGKFVSVANGSDAVAYSRDGINWKTELKLISQNGKDVTADTLIALEHTHEASKISSGTFAGQVVANASGQTPGTKLIRNSKLMAAADYDAVTDWATVLSEGEIAWRCE